MLFCKNMKDLYDDDFEGSSNECQIFREVFCKDTNSFLTKKCLSTSAINLGGDCSKSSEILYFNSDISSTTSQASSQNECLGELCNANKRSSEGSVPGFLSESLVGSSEYNESAKRIRFCSSELSDLEADMKKISNSSSASRDMSVSVSFVNAPASESAPFNLVEKSKSNVTSTCSLVKQYANLDNRDAFDKQEPFNSVRPNFDDDDINGIMVSKTVSSPISQESSATKLLLVGPRVSAGKNSGLKTQLANRQQDSCAVGMIEFSTKMKSPCPLLLNHVGHIFTAAGWRIERHKSPSRKYMDSIYVSPEGRRIRHFTTAWRKCMELLIGDRYRLIEEDDAKMWTGYEQFCADLSNTLSVVENETNQSEAADALVHWWCLLNPFVTVVYTERKVGLMKKGNVVKAARVLLIEKEKGVSTITMDTSRDKFVQSTASTRLLCSSLVAGSQFSSHFGNCSGPTGESETLHTHQDSNIDISGCDKQSFEHAARKLGEDLYYWNGNNESLKDQAAVFCYSLDSICRSDGVDNISKAHLNIPVQQNEPILPEFMTPHIERERLGSIEALSGTDVFPKKKSRRKSKKISEIEVNPQLQGDNISLKSVCKNESQDVAVHNTTLVQECSPQLASVRKPGSSCKPQLHKKESILKKKLGASYALKVVEKQGQIDDGDFLISALIKTNDVRSSTATHKKIHKSTAQRKLKSKRGSCRLLLRSFVKKGRHLKQGTGARTVLSWLINGGAISQNDVIQYRDLNDNTVIKSGTVSLNGIVCHCCNKVLSVSDFKVHAGWKLNCPCLNLFLESGKPFTLCELEAWSIEYKTRKSAIQKLQVDENDPNDDSCGVCGGVGELICCDNCPSAFHQACLWTEDIPEGSWYCLNCSCRMCGNLVNDKQASISIDAVKCSQCNHKYHKACMQKRDMSVFVSDNWFCNKSCLEIFSGLQSHIGLSNHLIDGICWTLLKCFNDDQSVQSAQGMALQAECNSKLAVASSILGECFLSMKDATTGIDMIPQVIYNWGSEYARLNYHGFYTMVLEKNDVLISVASIRIHGVEVAEMPLIATCSSYRRQGMCRRLVRAIEEMLRSLKVEKLVVAAIPGVVETWTKGFGFTVMDDKEKDDLKKISLMIFPGTVYLKKILNANRTDGQSGSCEVASIEMETPVYPESKLEVIQQSTTSCSAVTVGAENDNEFAGLEDLQEVNHSLGMDIVKSVQQHDCGSVNEVHVD